MGRWVNYPKWNAQERLLGEALPQPNRDSLRPPCLSSFNTERTEHLSNLCVESFLDTEGTEAVLTQGEISAAREEVGPYRS